MLFLSNDDAHTCVLNLFCFGLSTEKWLCYAGFGLQAVSDNAVLISTTSLGGILVVVVVMREVKFPTRQPNDK